MVGKVDSLARVGLAVDPPHRESAEQLRQQDDRMTRQCHGRILLVMAGSYSPPHPLRSGTMRNPRHGSRTAQGTRQAFIPTGSRRGSLAGEAITGQPGNWFDGVPVGRVDQESKCFDLVGLRVGVDRDQAEPASFLMSLFVAILLGADLRIADRVDVDPVAEPIDVLAGVRQSMFGSIARGACRLRPDATSADNRPRWPACRTTNSCLAACRRRTATSEVRC